jgi:hypothetical protein
VTATTTDSVNASFVEGINEWGDALVNFRFVPFHVAVWHFQQYGFLAHFTSL